MSELFGNPEQLSELSGNPEQLPYTPTTEEVKFAWKFMRFQQGAENYGEIANAEFDRWLAEVKADAFAQGRDSQRDHAEHLERERIIKLLEANIEDDEDQYRLGWAIALIKGEEQ